MMKNPKISIITPTFNSEKYLRQTIDSVLDQSYQNIEYIIVDGGSRDETKKIIESYGDKISKFITGNDNGVYDAMNKGIELATGDLIGIINSDDWYENNAIEIIVSRFNEEDGDIYYGILSYIKDEKEFLIYGSDHNFLPEIPLQHPTMFVKREVYSKIGYFALKYKIAADYDFELRALQCNLKFIRIKKVLANFRIGGLSKNYYRSSYESLKIRYSFGHITLVNYYISIISINFIPAVNYFRFVNSRIISFFKNCM